MTLVDGVRAGLRAVGRLSAVWALTLCACSTDDDAAASDTAYSREAKPLVFEGACAPGDTLTIAAVGDVLLHTRLQKQGLAHEDGFTSLWWQARELIASADVAYANLEGPTAPGVTKSGAAVSDPGPSFDGVVYTSYPQFNYHPSLIDGLLDTGIDVVSTANNHSLDRLSLGADRTIDELEQRGMPFTGTRKREDDRPRWTVTEARGFRLAWLACTYGTNGIADHHDQVAKCWGDRQALLAEITTLQQRDDIDAVIVTPHWGDEYEPAPNDAQRELAHDFLDAGAAVVIGAHPHVLQPWERYVTRDGREGFVIYSLGNFVSGQRHLARRSTMLLFVGLTRDADGEVLVNGARYVPLHMAKTSTEMTIEVVDAYGGDQTSRANTVEMFGLHNLAPPATPIRTNPECDASWSPVQATDGWIGGSCSQDGVCGGGVCEGTWPGGMCTESCDKYCPEAEGRGSTFCIDGGDGGMCVLQCEAHADCRDGYRCEARSRHNQPSKEAKVCVPG